MVHIILSRQTAHIAVGLCVLLGFWIGKTYAAPPIVRPNYQENTLIAPLYFGPNAFPVPEVLDGRVQKQFKAELAGEYYAGFQGDWTADVLARVYIPLFTERANLTLWMPVMEWYGVPQERAQFCRVPCDSAYMRGHNAGDVYVSTDIQLLRDKGWYPDILLRAALKTASGGEYERARTYDAPGYFFDLALGKSLYIKEKNVSNKPCEKAVELRLFASAGFLCWQTDRGRQNDAVMYGVGILCDSRYVCARATFSGYVGWENEGDRPMVMEGRIAGHIKGFEPFVSYQYGIADYPFHCVQGGVCYYWDILKHKKK